MQVDPTAKRNRFDFSLNGVFAYGLILGVVCEVLTLTARFGMGFESTRDTQWIGDYSFGLRIHHGYVGVLLIIAAALLLRGRPRLKATFLTLGIGLFFSDLVHHFLILWPLTGSPQFDFVYSVLAP